MFLQKALEMILLTMLIFLGTEEVLIWPTYGSSTEVNPDVR